MKFEDQKQIMLEKQIIARGIVNQRLITVMTDIDREVFVPPAQRHLSYDDSALPIGSGQTISQPFIIAYMLDCLDIKANDIVLEIGTGSGYQTSIIAQLAHEVYTVERISNLSLSAKRLLKEQGIKNIHYRIGDGTKGWEKAYPPRDTFDKIVVCAGSPQVASALLRQLAEGGKLIIPVGSMDGQELVLYTKKSGEITSKKMIACRFVPLIGEEGWKE